MTILNTSIVKSLNLGINNFNKFLDKNLKKIRVIEGSTEKKMKGDEFKIILEDINEKFDTLIEGQNLINEKLDRHIEENKEEFKEVKKEILLIKGDVFDLKKDVSGLQKDVSDLKGDVSDLKKDLNEHRENTELHVGRKKKKVS